MGRIVAIVLGLAVVSCAAGGGEEDEAGSLGEGSSSLADSVPAPRYCNEQLVPISRLPLRANGQPINVEEPFVYVTGSRTYLYFSDKNDNETRDLHVAVWVVNGFMYLAKLAQVGPGGPPNTMFLPNNPYNLFNTPDAIEAAPSIDSRGNFYFTDSRSPGMVGVGTITMNLLSSRRPVQGLPPPIEDANHFLHGNMDLGIAPNHPFGLVSRAAWRMPASGMPAAADLLYVQAQTPDSFVFDPSVSDYFMKNINTPNALEYAGAVSEDGLSMYFTRTWVNPVRTMLMMAERTALNLPFGVPIPIGGVDPQSLVEAPTVLPGGERIFYHKLSASGAPSQVYTVQRCP